MEMGLIFDKQVSEKLTELQKIQVGFSELIPLADDITGLLKSSHVSDTNYYRKLMTRKISAKTMLRIIRGLIEERNFLLNKVNQYQKNHKNG